MLTEIYIEAMLVDEELADQVWDAGEIGEVNAWWAWYIIVSTVRLLILSGDGQEKN